MGNRLIDKKTRRSMSFVFYNVPATPEYNAYGNTLARHEALTIYARGGSRYLRRTARARRRGSQPHRARGAGDGVRAWLCVRTPELRPVAGAGRRPVRTGGVYRGHHAHARWAAAASQLPLRADRRQRATASAAGTQRAAGRGGRGRVGRGASPFAALTAAHRSAASR